MVRDRRFLPKGHFKGKRKKGKGRSSIIIKISSKTRRKEGGKGLHGEENPARRATSSYRGEGEGQEKNISSFSLGGEEGGKLGVHREDANVFLSEKGKGKDH